MPTFDWSLGALLVEKQKRNQAFDFLLEMGLEPITERTERRQHLELVLRELQDYWAVASPGKAFKIEEAIALLLPR